MVQNGTNIIAFDTHQHKLEFGGDTIMIELDAFKKLMEENDDRLPLLTLNEFFEGNTAEDSIAPNECGFGRPSIAEIWELMRNLEKRPDIAWIRIELHDDTEIAEYDGKEVLVLAENHLLSVPLSQRWNWNAMQDVNGCILVGRRNGIYLRWTLCFPVGLLFQRAFVVLPLCGTK